ALSSATGGFFFQAEDGIRDFHVTGVQTCALPISAGKKGISAFIVPTDTPGYEVVSVEHKLGQHSSDTCALAFTNMRIPVENRLRSEERRVGKECRAREERESEKQNKEIRVEVKME